MLIVPSVPWAAAAWSLKPLHKVAATGGAKKATNGGDAATSCVSQIANETIAMWKTAPPVENSAGPGYIPPMLPFEEAQRRIVRAAQEIAPLACERVSVENACGRVLAERLVSPIAVPAHDYSAMDGYAVALSSLRPDEVTRLPVTCESRTGHQVPQLAKGECARIFTGAAIPSGADTVVMQEEVERAGDQASFPQGVRPGAHIRRKGEDLQPGEVVLEEGSRLGPFHLALLSTIERSEVLVRARPRVAILCTGDELRAPGSTFFGGHLAESNSLGLAALVQQAGGIPQRGPLVRDESEPLMAQLKRAAAHSDVVFTVGGVSVGDHDLVRPALEQLGAEILFHKVQIKPGKPVLFARLGATLVLGLPGNPLSAQVVACTLGLPLLRSLCQDNRAFSPRRFAQLRDRLQRKAGRTGFLPARRVGQEVEVLTNQSSGASTSLAWADCLLIVPAEQTELEAGATVEVLPFAEL